MLDTEPPRSRLGRRWRRTGFAGRRECGNGGIDGGARAGIVAALAGKVSRWDTAIFGGRTSADDVADNFRFRPGAAVRLFSISSNRYASD